MTEAERLLHKHGIYSVHGYAWSGPDYVGLAMWELTPPFQHDEEALMNGGKIVDYEPTKRDEVLLRNGEDFVGTMEFARRSLGMALCYASARDQKYNVFGKAPFWHAVATTLTWLNVASDRDSITSSALLAAEPGSYEGACDSAASSPLSPFSGMLYRFSLR
jgi:hypothetical protein